MANPDYWRSVGLEKWLSKIHAPQGGADAWQQVIGRVSEALDPATSDHKHTLEALAEVTAPTLIIAGDRDPLVPLESGNGYVSYDSSRRFVVVALYHSCQRYQYLA